MAHTAYQVCRKGRSLPEFFRRAKQSSGQKRRRNATPRAHEVPVAGVLELLAWRLRTSLGHNFRTSHHGGREREREKTTKHTRTNTKTKKQQR